MAAQCHSMVLHQDFDIHVPTLTSPEPIVDVVRYIESNQVARYAMLDSETPTRIYANSYPILS